MSSHLLAAGILLSLAVGLALVCSFGVAVMRDPWQRLQLVSPVVIWSALLIAIAVWLDEADWQARIKVVLVAGLLFVMNAILSHATARAVRIHRAGHWPLRHGEDVPILGESPLPQNDGGTGESP